MNDEERPRCRKCGTQLHARHIVDIHEGDEYTEYECPECAWVSPIPHSQLP